MAAHIGNNSPLMKMLSPTERDGLLDRLSKVVGTELNSQSEKILGEFSLDNQEGALNRLLIQLTDKHNNVGNSLKEKVDDVIKQFSLNDEKSFFSQLQCTLNKTSDAINNNLTLDDENSSLARLQRRCAKFLKSTVMRTRNFRRR